MSTAGTAVRRTAARLEHTGLRLLMGLPRPLMRRLAGPPVERDGLVLDTETQWMLRLSSLLGETAPEEQPIEEARRTFVRQTRLVGGDQPIGAVQDLYVPGADGELKARLYVPRTQTGAAAGAAEVPEGLSPLLVWFHGGGMTYGDLDSYDAVCRFLAEHADVRVLAVDYRLAPEHPFPAPIDDCWTAYAWVAEHADDLGADPDLLAVGGDSAGGYFAGLVALQAARHGAPLRHQLLIYPVTTMADTTGSRRTFRDGFYLTKQFMDLAEDRYLPAGQDRRDERVSLLYTEKVPDGLAPAQVVTAGFDPLRDEGEQYAWMLLGAGVEVSLRRYPGFIHSFANVVGVGRAAPAAMAEIAAALGGALHRP